MYSLSIQREIKQDGQDIQDGLNYGRSVILKEKKAHLGNL